MNVADMMNCAADGVDQCLCSASEIIPFSHFRDFRKLYSVVQDFTDIIEQNRRDKAFSALFLLLFDKRIKAAYRIA